MTIGLNEFQIKGEQNSQYDEQDIRNIPQTGDMKETLSTTYHKDEFETSLGSEFDIAMQKIRDVVQRMKSTIVQKDTEDGNMGKFQCKQQISRYQSPLAVRKVSAQCTPRKHPYSPKTPSKLSIVTCPAVQSSPADQSLDSLSSDSFDRTPEQAKKLFDKIADIRAMVNKLQLSDKGSKSPQEFKSQLQNGKENEANTVQSEGNPQYALTINKSRLETVCDDSVFYRNFSLDQEDTDLNEVSIIENSMLRDV
ncbi:hypothetical protein MP228_002152 [Amoeboaphelidium protococcarum]|nr:hypothetical protein MP228_002152 [Amoeboaphelidium protococcarum]